MFIRVADVRRHTIGFIRYTAVVLLLTIAIKTLLVPVDLSDASKPVLDQAAELAKHLSARIILLHIVEPVATYIPVGATIDVIAAAPPPVETTESIAAPDPRLKALAEPLEKAGLKVEIVSLVGLAIDGILEQAEKCHANYIILGSHGHGALHHLFSESVVTGILKRAKCPVLVVP